MIYEEWSRPDEVFCSDACLEGCGGFWNGKYFHCRFPSKIANNNINVCEMLAIMVCLKLWGKHFAGKRIQIFCDNESVCQVVNSGRTRNDMLQSCLRELTFISAKMEFQIRAIHLSG